MSRRLQSSQPPLFRTGKRHRVQGACRRKSLLGASSFRGSAHGSHSWEHSSR
ncbi:rCG53581, partial [Rattus norvegicus]